MKVMNCKIESTMIEIQQESTKVVWTRPHSNSRDLARVSEFFKILISMTSVHTIIGKQQQQLEQ